MNPTIAKGEATLSVSQMDAAIEYLRRGDPILVMDDVGREHEGDLVLAAELATPETVNFLIRNACGLMCVALTSEIALQLRLRRMVRRNQDPHGTAFTTSVDAHQRHGVTTGISAWDRCTTARLLADPNAVADDFRQPGHMFPLVAVPGGVLRRRGHTEASTDLLQIAGLRPVAIIMEVLREDGSMARQDDLATLAANWRMPLLTVEEIATSVSAGAPLQSASR